MRHIHHIVPKHMGGSNEPSNLISLTIDEHAEAHKWLFLEHELEKEIESKRIYDQTITLKYV